MKKYKIYRNIRKGAMIWGLPISLFSLLIVSVVASLLVIIFSFNLGVIMATLVWNSSLYIALTKFGKRIKSVPFANPFPTSITNRKENILDNVNY